MDALAQIGLVGPVVWVARRLAPGGARKMRMPIRMTLVNRLGGAAGSPRPSSKRIILRGGPFTGEIPVVHPRSTTFRALSESDRWATYEATGLTDPGTGLPIFVYAMPQPGRPPPQTRPPKPD